MGVHKASSSKVAKKGSKLDSLKNLVFGGSSTKKQSSPAKTSASEKDVDSSATKAHSGKAAGKAHPGKTNSTANSANVGQTTTKSGGKAKVNSSAVQSSSKNAAAHDSKSSSKSSKSSGASAKRISSSLLGGRLDSLAETVCREVACEGLATSGGYCRMHYIKNWKKIKRKELILREKKLNQYIEELVAKYPDKYIEAIRQDLASDKDFAKVIYDLDLDEGVDDFDIEGGESVDSLIDTIKRDFDDDGEGY